MSPVTKVSDDGLVATLHLPRESRGRRPAVIGLSGSEGGVVNANGFGAPLAAAGFVTMSLVYFAMDGLPRDLLESARYFKKAIDWLRVHPAVDADRVAVFGMSRGGEAALVVGATFSLLRAVVANVPSHLVWQGNHPDQSVKTSSWTLGGADLPYAPLAEPRVGETWREWFEASLKTAPPEAAIPVERINGPVYW